MSFIDEQEEVIRVNLPDISELSIAVDIFPSQILGISGSFQQQKIRFLVDDVVIPILSFDENAAANKIGTDLSVTLARESDRNAILNGSEYSLEIGFVVNGVIQWTVVNSGFLNNNSYQIGMNQRISNDSVSIGTASTISNKVNISPPNPTVIFDSSEMDLNSSDFPRIYGTNGGIYSTVLIPIHNLSLHAILNIVLTGFCGLPYYTNIPNFPIKRLDIGFGQSCYQAISGLIGMFNPLFIENGGVLQILDATMVSPSGFSAPIQYKPDTYKTISINGNQEIKIDGYLIEHVQDDDAWDSFEIEVNTTSNLITDPQELKSTLFETETHTKNYLKEGNEIPIKSETFQIYTKTTVQETANQTDADGNEEYDANGNVIQETTTKITNSTREFFYYDALDRLQVREKYESQRVPVWVNLENLAFPTDGKWEYQFLDVKYEKDEYLYAENPFKEGEQFRQILYQFSRGMIYVEPEKQYETKNKSGLVEIDPEKEVPEQYRQSYVDAYLGGNLADDGTTEFGPLTSRFERVTPRPNDEAIVETKENDYITGVSRLNVTEQQVGALSQSGQIQKTKKVVVFGPNGRTNGRIESLSTGDMSYSQGIALASRLLQRKNAGNSSITMELIGLDMRVRRGLVLNAVGRNNENLGNYLTEGFRRTGTNINQRSQTLNTNIQGRKT